jgi:glycosyltransferase involved in cell wall biosynthesis
MKKVLIVTYSFPPSNNVAIHRILRIGKWLPRYGWEPVILTPDYTLTQRIDMDNLKFVEKYFKKVYRVSGAYETMIKNIIDKKNRNILSRIIRRYFIKSMVSDISNLWRNNAIKRGREIIQKENISAIWSSLGPPITGIIGAELKKQTQIPLLIDYRDPWTLNPYRNYTGDNLENNIRNELDMLSVTDTVITTSNYIKELIENNKYYRSNNIHVITNGYDEELQWINKNNTNINLDDRKINITYTGSFYRDRQPYSFLDGLKLFLSEKPEYSNNISFNIIGNLDYPRNIYKYCESIGLCNILNEEGVVQYSVAMQHLQKSDVLLLVNGMNDDSKIFIPGKLFDYMVTKKPILFIGGGQPAEIITKHKLGLSVPHDPNLIKHAINEIIKWKADNNLPEEYNIKHISSKVSELLNRITQ